MKIISLLLCCSLLWISLGEFIIFKKCSKGSLVRSIYTNINLVLAGIFSMSVILGMMYAFTYVISLGDGFNTLKMIIGSSVIITAFGIGKSFYQGNIKENYKYHIKLMSMQVVVYAIIIVMFTHGSGINAFY